MEDAGMQYRIDLTDAGVGCELCHAVAHVSRVPASALLLNSRRRGNLTDVAVCHFNKIMREVVFGVEAAFFD